MLKVVDVKTIKHDPKRKYGLNLKPNIGRIRIFPLVSGSKPLPCPVDEPRAYVKALREPCMTVLEGFGLDGQKLVWNWKAGCACGCSAGFVLDATGDYDIFVDLA